MNRVVRMARAIPREVRHGRRALRNWPRYAVDVLAYRGLGVWPSMPSCDRERQVVTRDGIRLTYRRNRGDIQGIREVFCEEHYRIPPSMRPATLVDLGANIGLTSVWFAKRCGVARVVGVEPVGANVAIARRNLADNQVEGEIVEAAIGPVRGRVSFELDRASNLGRVGPGRREPGPPGPGRREPGPPGPGPRQPGSSGTGPRQPGSSRTGPPETDVADVEMITMHDVLARLGSGADLVKLDIEGGEDALLQGDLSWLDQVGAIIAELHPAVVDCQEIASRLSARGFRHLPPSALWPDSMAIFVGPRMGPRIGPQTPPRTGPATGPQVGP